MSSLLSFKLVNFLKEPKQLKPAALGRLGKSPDQTFVLSAFRNDTHAVDRPPASGGTSTVPFPVVDSSTSAESDTTCSTSVGWASGGTSTVPFPVVDSSTSAESDTTCSTSVGWAFKNNKVLLIKEPSNYEKIDLTEKDILSTRGTPGNLHTGITVYWMVVLPLREEYLNFPSRGENEQKERLALSVADSFHETGGRFLSDKYYLVERGELVAELKGPLYIMDGPSIKRKVQNALREVANIPMALQDWAREEHNAIFRKWEKANAEKKPKKMQAKSAIKESKTPRKKLKATKKKIGASTSKARLHDADPNESGPGSKQEASGSHLTTFSIHRDAPNPSSDLEDTRLQLDELDLSLDTQPGSFDEAPSGSPPHDYMDNDPEVARFLAEIDFGGKDEISMFTTPAKEYNCVRAVSPPSISSGGEAQATSNKTSSAGSNHEASGIHLTTCSFHRDAPTPSSHPKDDSLQHEELDLSLDTQPGSSDEAPSGSPLHDYNMDNDPEVARLWYGSGLGGRNGISMFTTPTKDSNFVRTVSPPSISSGGEDNADRMTYISSDSRPNNDVSFLEKLLSE